MGRGGPRTAEKCPELARPLLSVLVQWSLAYAERSPEENLDSWFVFSYAVGVDKFGEKLPLLSLTEKVVAEDLVVAVCSEIVE